MDRYSGYHDGGTGFVQLAKAQMAQFERRGFKLPITDEEKKACFNTLGDIRFDETSCRIEQRPIYFWHGKQDTVVPYKPTYNFYEAVKKDYADVPERIEFVSDDTAGHAVSRQECLQQQIGLHVI